MKIISTFLFLLLFLFSTSFAEILISDINTGNLDSNPEKFAELNNILIFLAEDSTHGRELWRSDGTSNGTYLLKDIYPETTDSLPRYFEKLGNLIFFEAYSNSDSKKLWCTDGTINGTFQFYGTDNPEIILKTTTFLLFTVTNDSYGRELWRSDGTQKETYMLKDINPGSNWSSPKFLISVNNLYYFEANNNNVGKELWRTDGTALGTFLLTDINPNSADSRPEIISVLGNKLLFKADDGGGTERKLWVTDGSTDGTLELKDTYNGNEIQTIKPTIVSKRENVLFFNSTDPALGRELWRTDGTQDGTFLLADADEGTGWSSPDPICDLESVIIYEARTPEYGEELWRSDGTKEGTNILQDINIGSGDCFAEKMVVLNNIFLFNANDGIKNTLWITDGTSSGTHKINAKSPEYLQTINGIVYFYSKEGNFIHHLWRSDGTVEGTYKLQNANFNQTFSVLSDIYIFEANDNEHGKELWRTDGTRDGTYMLKDFYPGPNGYSATALEIIGDYLYFKINDGGTSQELWKTDGTSAGTFKLRGRNDSEETINPEFVAKSNNIIYFLAESNEYGRELYHTDGSVDGTYMLKDIRRGYKWSNIDNVIFMNNLLFFTANDGIHGEEMWVSDGSSTPSHTYMLKDCNADSTTSYPQDLQESASPNKYIFKAKNSDDEYVFWETDGTKSNTFELLAGSSRDNSNNREVAKKAKRGKTQRGTGDAIGIISTLTKTTYMRGYDNSHGYELWAYTPSIPSTENFVPPPNVIINISSQDTSFSGTLDSYGIQGEDLTYILVDLPEIGLIEINSETGDFTYDTGGVVTGMSSFSYKIDNEYSFSEVITVPITIGDDSLELTIKPGWNLLSLPFTSNFVDGRIFKNTDDKLLYIGSIWLWNVAEKQYYKLSNTIEANNGFWLYGSIDKVDITNTIYGISSQSELDFDELPTGWNLIGPSVDQLKILDSIPQKKLWFWQHHLYEQATDLLRGYGYWYFQ
ncbi:MAG: hypothetical protein U9O87_10365 [Verrucomicrobiota bacterium]|nr:hypothetical protein [Verrucomicrobiota bacterium]